MQNSFRQHCLALLLANVLGMGCALAQDTGYLASTIDQGASGLEQKVITWRRDIHANPELSNREFRTSKLVAEHLESLGLEVKTGIAHTGVVGVLRGGKPGPVVALRADMDALPVMEQTDVPFASKVTAEYGDKTVPVAHVCGHDTHTAILMGVAELLVGVKDQIPGTIKFIFQPAEEGVPAGETGGAKQMVAEGVLVDPRPSAIFGLHTDPRLYADQLGFRSGPTLSASSTFHIVVKGRQTHGGLPWLGVDPFIPAAQIVMGLQSITGRQLDVTKGPSVISLGIVQGGVRENVIPEQVELKGTIRTFDEGNYEKLAAAMKEMATSIASASGAEAIVTITPGYPLTFNNEQLSERSLPTLQKVAGKGNVVPRPILMPSEDFSYYAREIPGFFFFFGVTPRGQDLKTAAPNHSPRFYVDESSLKLGVRAMSQLALDYLASGGLDEKSK